MISFGQLIVLIILIFFLFGDFRKLMFRFFVFKKLYTSKKLKLDDKKKDSKRKK